MRELTEFEKYVIEDKGTERPFSGDYVTHDALGVYLCKKCAAPLYRSEHKFNAHCGWPAFDDEIPGAVTRHPDTDGRRTEIVCSHCGGHLGHVFEGEYLTSKNVRHCVNSVSLVFKPSDSDIAHEAQGKQTALATFGGGCFWCTEAIFTELKGVMQVTSGYAGGLAADADYERVCSGRTGHAEVVQLQYDPQTIAFETLLEVFFQSHDPTTLNRQGNDKGPQYRSVIFAHGAAQIEASVAFIRRLDESGQFNAPIVTELTAYSEFFPAEAYHERYFALHGEQPYCQLVVKPKVDKFRKAFAEKSK